MAFSIIVKEEATAETLEAYLYYEAQVNGLGDKFLQELMNCYNKISANPQFYGFISSKKVKTLRDLQIAGFPSPASLPAWLCVCVRTRRQPTY